MIPVADALASRYRIERELGRGGMATVYLAEDLKHHRLVAIKVLGTDVAAAIGAERFLREIEIVARLQHPHILPLHDSGEARGFLYYVMPYVEGESLRDRLVREKQLSLEEGARIVREVADALAYAHGRGLVHRDIKPENILLSGRHALLADFGIASAMSATSREKLTRTGVSVGTPAYMSPEQAAGSGAPDARCDLYSLGCVLYEVLAGQPPFIGPNVESVVHQHLAVPPPPITNLRPNTPTGIGVLLDRAMAKLPADRYANAEEFAKALEAALAVKEPGPAPPPARRGPRGRFVVAAALAAAAVVVAAALRIRGCERATGRIESLAVLPLENSSGDPQQEFFADGMTEALIADLARIEALRVISRTSIMRYRGARRSAREIGRELDVDAIVDGSVLRSGGRVRITIQLIEASRDRHLWAETYHRDIGDVLELQGEIARAVASEIRVKVTAGEAARLAGARRPNPEAYEAFLKGRYELAKASVPAFEKALGYFLQATELDSTYALAFVGLADAYISLGNRGRLAPDEAFRPARTAALTALELDPGLGEAHNSLASISMNSWDWGAAEREHHRAIALNPGYADAHERYALLLAYLGRNEEAMVEVGRALKLDPLSPQANANLGLYHYYARRYRQAIDTLRKALELEPSNASAWLYLAWACPEAGMHAEAVAAAEKGVAAGGHHNTLSALGYAHARAGNRAGAQAVLRDLEARAKREYVAPYEFAIVHVGLGHNEEALGWLERGFREHDARLRRLGVDPKFDPVRADPRLRELLRRIGLAGPV